MLKKGTPVTPVTTVWGFEDVSGVITGHYNGGYFIEIRVDDDLLNCWRVEEDIVVDKRRVLKSYFK